MQVLKKQKEKTKRMVSVFEKMTDEDQEALQKVADALYAKNPRKLIDLKLVISGFGLGNQKIAS